MSNLEKIIEIDKEIFSDRRPLELEIIQPYEKDFAQDLIYKFESETDRIIPNKGKYHHFVKKRDSSY